MVPQRMLELTRAQILAFRRRAGALDERLPRGARSLRRAAWAGLTDSVPRAALLSIHARVERTQPSSWEDPSLVQVWGPRYSVYVVPARDRAVFTLGRLPDDARRRARAEDMAARVHAYLAGRRLKDNDVQKTLGIGNAIKYAAPTGTLLIRWDGARAPDGLDGAAARDRTVRGTPRVGPPLPARLRPGDPAGVRGLGGRQGGGRLARRSTG